MAKLKCKDHKRRVFVTDNLTSLHREDGTVCDSKLVNIGVMTYAAADIPKVAAYKTLALSVEKALLKEIFGNEYVPVSVQKGGRP